MKCWLAFISYFEKWEIFGRKYSLIILCGICKFWNISLSMHWIFSFSAATDKSAITKMNMNCNWWKFSYWINNSILIKPHSRLAWHCNLCKTCSHGKWQFLYLILSANWTWMSSLLLQLHMAVECDGFLLLSAKCDATKMHFISWKCNSAPNCNNEINRCRTDESFFLVAAIFSHPPTIFHFSL